MPLTQSKYEQYKRSYSCKQQLLPLYVVLKISSRRHPLYCQTLIHIHYIIYCVLFIPLQCNSENIHKRSLTTCILKCPPDVSYLKHTINLSIYFFTGEEWTGSYPYQIVGGVLITAMALGLLAAVSYQCAATWKWLKGRTRRDSEESNGSLSKQAAIRISHSLPDLQTEPLKQEYVQEHKENSSKKVGLEI